MPGNPYGNTGYNSPDPNDPMGLQDPNSPINAAKKRYMFDNPQRGGRQILTDMGYNPYGSNPFIDFLSNEAEAAYTRSLFGNTSYDAATTGENAKTQLATQGGSFDANSLNNWAGLEHEFYQPGQANTFIQKHGVDMAAAAYALSDPRTAWTYVRSLASGMASPLQQAMVNLYSLLSAQYEDYSGGAGAGTNTPSFLEWLVGSGVPAGA